MRVEKVWFYRDSTPWRKTKKRIKERQSVPHCESCGRSGVTLVVHHVYPIEWDEEGYIEVEDITELTDCVFDILCKRCHDKMEKGGDVVDVITRIVNGKEI